MISKEGYQALMDLVEIFDNSIIEGEEVWCFKLIKEIVDGQVLREDICARKRILAEEQLCKAIDWLRSLGVVIEYQNELLAVINTP